MLLYTLQYGVRYYQWSRLEYVLYTTFANTLRYIENRYTYKCLPPDLYSTHTKQHTRCLYAIYLYSWLFSTEHRQCTHDCCLFIHLPIIVNLIYRISCLRLIHHMICDATVIMKMVLAFILNFCAHRYECVVFCVYDVWCGVPTYCLYSLSVWSYVYRTPFWRDDAIFSNTSFVFRSAVWISFTCSVTEKMNK